MCGYFSLSAVTISRQRALNSLLLPNKNVSTLLFNIKFSVISYTLSFNFSLLLTLRCPIKQQVFYNTLICKEKNHLDIIEKSDFPQPDDFGTMVIE